MKVCVRWYNRCPFPNLIENLNQVQSLDELSTSGFTKAPVEGNWSHLHAFTGWYSIFVADYLTTLCIAYVCNLVVVLKTETTKS